jgi:hypothetical protein
MEAIHTGLVGVVGGGTTPSALPARVELLLRSLDFARDLL